LLLQFGGEWQGTRGEYEYRDEVQFDLLFMTPGAWTQPDRARLLSARPDGAQYAAYVNLRAEPLPHLTADAGVRWDKETLSAHRSDSISPRLSLLYSFDDRTRVRASWGRFFQSQGVAELQISDGVGEFLPAQRADHLVTSVEYSHPRGFDLRLEAYRKDYRRIRPRFENLLNTFVLLPELKPDRVRIAPDRAKATGVELTLRGKARRPFSWWLSYTWSSVEDEFGELERRRIWDQTHFVSGGITWQSERWEFSLAGTYHTGWSTTEVELIATEPIPLAAMGARNGRRLSPFHTIDLRLARNFYFDRAGQLTAFVELTNLLNRDNECCVEYEIEDEDEEDVLNLDLQTLPYLPLTPSLGVVWRF
jgi:outer membrane receptor protein involved in Fe transport